jgi:hypothetical protein
MAYDKELAARMFDMIEAMNPPSLVEKKMFGGVAYLVQGNMACGVHQDGLMVRVGNDGYMAALNRPGGRPFDMTGRPMSGWVVVKPAGFQTDQALKEWISLGVQFALTLPPK